MPTQTVLAVYRVRQGNEDRFLEALTSHLPVLRQQGLVDDERPTVLRGHDDQGRVFVVEIFDWVSEEASSQAHDNEAVARIWAQLESLCEARDGRPAAEFPHVDRVRL